MPLKDSDWQSIYEAIRAAIPQNEITYGKVVRRDEKRKLIWLKEFGDQPIPLVGFNGHAKVYDEVPLGGSGSYGGKTTKVKKAKIVHEVPKVGQLVVVLRQMGSRRLPKCVGVVLSTGNFVVGE